MGTTRTVPITDSGSSVFEANQTGNGTFVTKPDPGNVGRGGMLPQDDESPGNRPQDRR